MLDIARAIGATLDLDALLALVMAKVSELLDAERSTLFLVDRERGEIWSKIAQGNGRHEIRLPVGRGLAGFVAQTGRAVNVKNAYEDPRFHPDVDRITGFQTESLLAVPLFGKDGGIAGVAQVLNKRGGAFGPDDERALTGLSGLVGVALENAQLYTAVRVKNEELERTQARLRQKVAEVDLLFEIEREISGAAGLEQMLQGILERAMATTNARAGAVLVTDDGQAELYAKVDAAPGLVATSLAARPEGLVARVLETGVGGVFDGNVPRGSAIALAGRPPGALVCVPIFAPSRAGPARITGVLELADRDPGAFSADDEKLASLVAAQLGRAVALARSRLESERAGRLAAVGQMLGGIVHDLRSPMTVIGGYAELMAREPDARERDGYATTIHSQLEHVNAMTREVLAYVRGERQLLVRRVALPQFWMDLRAVLARDLESRSVELVLETPFSGAARFDEAKVKRLITNLARNAAQAMTQGGTFRITCAADVDTLVLDLADDGPGIPPHVASKLFTAFNTHGKVGGTGLGLAIVREVVEAHGGDVTFTTGPSRGTTFHVRLPGAVVR